MKTIIALLILGAGILIASSEQSPGYITFCVVPNMVGMTNDEAWITWEAAGFTNFGVCWPAQFCETGHVISQNFTANSYQSCADAVLVLKVGE